MHGGEHGGNVDSLDPSSVRQEKIEKISWADGGVKAVGVAEATDPSVLDNVQDEGMAAKIAGSDELLGSKGGCTLTLSFLAQAISGVVGDVKMVQLVGVAHSVKADVGGERALVSRIGEDQSGRAAGVGTKGYGIEYGKDGFTEANHVVVRGRANNGGVALPRCFDQGDDVRGGRYDGNRQLGEGFLFLRTIMYEEERHCQR